MLTFKPQNQNWFIDRNERMKLYKQFFEFYINSSIHVALAVVSLCLVSFLHYDLPADINLLVFVFFGSITGYNFVKYAGVARLHHSSLAKGLKVIQVFSLFSFLILAWSAFKLSKEVLIWTGIFGIFTLLYALPVFSKRRNLRTISGVKIFIIAFVWGGVTVVLPVVSAQKVLDFNVAIEFIQRFLLVLTLILPFEIRDLKYDLQQLGTIPQRVGVTQTKLFGLSLLIMLLILEFLKQKQSLDSVAALLITVVVTSILIWRSRQRQSSYYSSFWVEGIPILWLIALILFKSF